MRHTLLKHCHQILQAAPISPLIYTSPFMARDSTFNSQAYRVMSET